MKRKTVFLSSLIISLLFTGACSNPAPADTQATIDAAGQATSDAQKNTQATIEAAVQGTSEAQNAGESAIATAVQATLAAQPTPDYSSLSEEELAAMIDEAVNTALADASTTSTSTTQATSDGTVTSEEAAAASTYIYETYYEVAYAEELIEAYYAYYGEYADEALATLNAMEDDLASISQSLAEIDAIMTQGAETASAAIDELNAAIENIETKAGEVQTQAEGWVEQVKTGLGQRENDLLNLQPNQVESDKIGALGQAHDFLDAFKGALTDGKFSPAELNQIGQLGANARASLLKTGDPQLEKFSGAIDGLTRNAARGEWGSARTGVGNFERSLPDRPGRR